MPNRIEIDPVFTRAYKKLVKKYPSFPGDLKGLVEDLKQNAHLGVSLGGNVRKIRLAIKSKGKGKSGGGSRHHLCIGDRRSCHFTDGV